MYKCGRGPDFQNITSQPPSLPQFDPFPLHDLSPALKQQYHIGCHKWSRNCFTFLSTRVHPGLERNSCCSILRVLCSILQIIACHFWPFTFYILIVCPFVCRFTASDNPFGIFKLYLYYPKDPTLFGIRYSSILQTGEIRIVLLLKMPVKATLLQLSRRASTQKYVFEGYQLCLSFYDLLILFGIAIPVRYLLCPADDSMRRYSSFFVCLYVSSFVRTSRIFVC